MDVFTHIVRYAGAAAFLVQGYRYSWVTQYHAGNPRIIKVFGFIVSHDTHVAFAEIDIDSAGVRSTWVYDETITHSVWIPTIREEFQLRYQEICSSDAVVILRSVEHFQDHADAKAIVDDLTRPVLIPIMYRSDGFADHARSDGFADHTRGIVSLDNPFVRPPGVLSAMSRVVWYPAPTNEYASKPFIVAVRNCFGMSPKLQVQWFSRDNVDGADVVNVSMGRHMMCLDDGTRRSYNVLDIRAKLARVIRFLSERSRYVEGSSISDDVQRIICAEIFEMVGRGIFEYSPHRIMVQTLGDAYLPDYSPPLQTW